MGVRGLTTFLRENRRALSRTQSFSTSFQPSVDQFTPLVVDGWSFIYTLYADSGLPWVYGGEYDAFAKCIQSIVRAWLTVGLEPYFVFDGPVPLAKMSTTINRLVDVIQTANIFFRTSPAARSTASFLSSNRIIPPLLLETTLDALRELRAVDTRVHVIMADDEADPACVALAGALGNGLVTAIDSDFAVLHVEGYGGYAPIDEMAWQSTAPGADDVQPPDDDGFRTITTKLRVRRKSSGLIPPPDLSDSNLILTIYHPHTLASHLSLPPALLPLLSALVGNDFSNPAHARKFFENRTTSVERVWKVARAVSAAVNKQHGAGGDAVLDVIRAAVMNLLVRPDLSASGEIDRIVEETVEAALESTIPAVVAPSPIVISSERCPLHSADECPLTLRLGDTSSELLRAYRAGEFSPRLMNAVSTGIILPKTFLEDPDQRTCASVTSGVWASIWTVLVARGHVQPPMDGKFDVKSPTDSRLDDSELISVVEEFTATEPSVCSDTDGLASELAERLKGLAGSFDDLDTDKTESVKETLVQYTRRGLKLIPEPAVFKTLGLETDEWTDADRVRVFLEGMRSYTPGLRSALKGQEALALWICVLRCVVQASAEHTGSGGTSPAALVGRWKKAEARAFVAGLCNPGEGEAGSLDVRAIQRVAQLLHAFDAGARLAEVTGLFGEGTNAIGQAVRMFSGRAVNAGSPTRVDDRLWDLVCEGMDEGVWASEPERRTKAKDKDKAKAKVAKPAGVGFNILAALGTE